MTDERLEPAGVPGLGEVRREAGITVIKAGYAEPAVGQGRHERGAKITDITTEAGRSAGSFYKHFAGKDDVLRALLADWLAQAGAELAADPAGDDLSREPALRARVAAYWHTYRAHLPEIRALGEAAQADPAFAESLAAMRHAGLATMQRHLERLRDTGHALPGDPAVLASVFNTLLEGFCQVWIAGGGEPIGRPLSDEEAIDTLTRLLMHGLTGRRQDHG